MVETFMNVYALYRPIPDAVASWLVPKRQKLTRYSHMHLLTLLSISSGTILDLLYLFLADGRQEQMQPDPDFDFGPLISMVSSFAKAGFEGLKKLHEQGKTRRKKERQWIKSRLGF